MTTIQLVRAPSPARRRNAPVLTASQISVLRAALGGRKLAVCFGAGVDSTAMLVALHAADLRPEIITFANVNAEKEKTLQHLSKMNDVLRGWGWPTVDVCMKKMLPSTPYSDLYGNCISNQTLPSLAFGHHGCSVKFKIQVQDQFIKGAAKGPNKRAPHPVWVEAQARGERLIKLIGYDAGPADRKRSKTLASADADFDFVYPLQLLGWTREDCVGAITRALGAAMVPVKSACFFCPASKHWELWYLAAEEPDQFERALRMEWNALTGKHSRFSTVDFGDDWEDLVRNADRFPSSKTTVGLGRSFAWNHWARINGVVDENFKVRRAEKARFLAMADALRGNDNALDARSCA